MATHAFQSRDAAPRETWHGERPWPACAIPPGAREDRDFHHEKTNVPLSFAKHEAWVFARVVGGLLLFALIVTLIITGLTGWPSLLLVPLLMVYAALLTAPILIAAVVDDAEEQADHGRTAADRSAERT